jgi:hypothetical protein
VIDMLKKYMLIAVLALSALAVSCVNVPVQSASVVDIRPQIAFKVTGSTSFMTVYVDGLNMGKVSDYLVGEAGRAGNSLRILPGPHQLVVKRGWSTIHAEKLYVGDGVSKVILLP